MNALLIASFEFIPTFSFNFLFYFQFLILKKLTNIYLFLIEFISINFKRFAYHFLITNFIFAMNHIFI